VGSRCGLKIRPMLWVQGRSRRRAQGLCSVQTCRVPVRMHSAPCVVQGMGCRVCRVRGSGTGSDLCPGTGFFKTIQSLDGRVLFLASSARKCRHPVVVAVGIQPLWWSKGTSGCFFGSSTSRTGLNSAVESPWHTFARCSRRCYGLSRSHPVSGRSHPLRGERVFRQE
jgi:hypothetical protein